MNDQYPGFWQASDGNWYPNEQQLPPSPHNRGGRRSLLMAAAVVGGSLILLLAGFGAAQLLDDDGTVATGAPTTTVAVEQRPTTSSAATTATTPTSVAVDPGAACLESFEAYGRARTDESKFATIQTCTEEQWATMQVRFQIPGATLDDLCGRRYGLPATACATADQARVDREAREAVGKSPDNPVPFLQRGDLGDGLNLQVGAWNPSAASVVRSGTMGIANGEPPAGMSYVMANVIVRYDGSQASENALVQISLMGDRRTEYGGLGDLVFVDDMFTGFGSIAKGGNMSGNRGWLVPTAEVPTLQLVATAGYNSTKVYFALR